MNKEKKSQLSNEDKKNLSKDKKTESQEKEDELHKIIGRQKVEIDFLKQALS